MIYFVYYNDGYYENGDVGLKICNTRDEAEIFISERISQDSKRTIDMYVVIEGNQLDIRAVEVVTKVQLF